MIESIRQRALLPDDAYARNVCGNAGSSSGMRIQSHAPYTDRERQREVVKRVQAVCDKAMHSVLSILCCNETKEAIGRLCPYFLTRKIVAPIVKRMPRLKMPAPIPPAGHTMPCPNAQSTKIQNPSKSNSLAR